MFLGPVEPD